MDQKRSRYSWLWLALFLLSAVATIIDWIDGYSAKTLSSAALTAAFGLLALGLYRGLGGLLVVLAFIGIAVAAFAFRLARWVTTGT